MKLSTLALGVALIFCAPAVLAQQADANQAATGTTCCACTTCECNPCTCGASCDCGEKKETKCAMNPACKEENCSCATAQVKA